MGRECQKELDQTVGKKWDVAVIKGKANLDVRPTFINKGESFKWFITSYDSKIGGTPDFLIFAGDDTTDEDKFRALNGFGLLEDHIFTIIVGVSSIRILAW